MTTQRPLRILLVEDDNAIGHVIAIGMQNLGVPYELDEALSAEEGLELWEAQPYDLLLTDYNLRGISGLSLITTLRRRGATCPTVLFTAYDTTQLRKDARSAGVTRFVSKPFVIDDFVAMARELLPLAANEVGMSLPAGSAPAPVQ
ncbi:MAG TPA: response regulator [Roseiflexaceae bacterium]|nr:response regulator [Roseiflexaceae bacterium]